MSIVGNTIGTTTPRPDWAQTDPKKADYIKNKPDLSGIERAQRTADDAATAAGNAATAANSAATAASKAQTTADAAKNTADAALLKRGGTMTGPLVVLWPTETGHAVNKGYVDGLHFYGEVELLASDWVGSGPFTQEVVLDGVTEEDYPHYGVVYGGTNDQKILQREAFSCIDDMEAGNGVLSFTCFDSKPSVDITVQIQCLRKNSDIGDQAVAVLSMEEGDGYPVQALIDGTNYNVRNAVLNGTPTEKTYDFTVL